MYIHTPAPMAALSDVLAIKTLIKDQIVHYTQKQKSSILAHKKVAEAYRWF